MQSLLAIASPTWRRILELLAVGEQIPGELAEEFDIGEPGISQPLNVLREDGLVTTRAEGQSRIRALNSNGIDDLEDWLEETPSIWSRRVDALERELRAGDQTNERKAKNKTSS